MPTTASAANISLRATPAHIGSGDTVLITVLFTSAVPSNAFSGVLAYSKTMLEPVAISDGDSVVNFWITRPSLSTASNSIAFAGITPGGFSGENGKLFSVLFKAKTPGIAKFVLENIEVLRNDGTGGTEPTTFQPFTLSVSPMPSGGYGEPADKISPEPFHVYIDTTPELFNGRKYLAFRTVDKGSGIDRYLIAETRIPSFLLPFFTLPWREVESPVVLTDQSRTSTAYVKAIDRAGNEQLSVFPPEHLFTSYEKALIAGILIAVVLLWHKRWGRRFRPNP